MTYAKKIKKSLNCVFKHHFNKNKRKYYKIYFKARLKK